LESISHTLRDQYLVWLSALEQKYGKNVDLSSVPSAEWDAMAKRGFDVVWLMGVWERSSAGIALGLAWMKIKSAILGYITS
jgi:hypothetical protein